jgi:DNA repair protein RecO (recombination protein O)
VNDRAGIERNAGSADAAYVLHAQPHKETSLLVETFTRPHGRVAMVARGARRPRSALRGVLLAFHPLSLGWFGKGEVRTLTRAEWLGGQAFLRGRALLCGYYLNELLLRLLPREDAHERLFAHYQDALAALARAGDPAPVLRAFEKALLAELGYALSLGGTAAAVDPAGLYCYDPEHGPVAADEPRGRALAARVPVVSGRTLLDLGRDDYADARTLAEAKALMRSLINHRLDNEPLRSRRVYRELLNL